jgi:hypothetical protein
MFRIAVLMVMMVALAAQGQPAPKDKPKDQAGVIEKLQDVRKSATDLTIGLLAATAASVKDPVKTAASRKLVAERLLDSVIELEKANDEIEGGNAKVKGALKDTLKMMHAKLEASVAALDKATTVQDLKEIGKSLASGLNYRALDQALANRPAVVPKKK